MVKINFSFSHRYSLWILLLYILSFLPLVDSSLTASDVVLSLENGGTTSTTMSPETWTITADSASNYSPSVTFESSSCGTVTNTNYSITSVLKSRARNSSINFSLTITTGDSSYVLILGFCDDSTSRSYSISVAGVTISTSFNPGSLAGTCKILELYNQITLSNSGTKITISGSTYTLSSTNVIPISLWSGNNGQGQAPIINYTILVKGDCSKANYCSMCNDQLCATCNVATRVCSTCISGASVSGSLCACPANNYYNSAVPACQICDTICSTCVGGGVFACSACTSASYYLINTVCLYGCPYGYSGSSCTTSPTGAVIDVNFNQDFAGSYGIFNTGTSSSTYQFFVNPESVDPIPSYLEGFYFSSTSPGYYLASSSTLWLSHTFSIALWAYSISTSNDLVGKGTLGSCILRIQGSGAMTLTLQSPSLTTTSITSNTLTMTTGVWILLSYSVAYSSYSTTVTPYKNNVAVTGTTTAGYVYRETAASTLYIGQGNSYFNGFIYNFKLWNTNYSPFTTEYTGTELCTAGGSACFGTCTFGQYYDTATTSCKSCSSCTKGCTRASSCNICYDPLCSVCTGFGSGKCSTCVTNASKTASTDCACNSGYYLSDPFTCTACYSGCSTCTGTSYYQCTACVSTKYFLSIMCLSYCPTGYTQDSTNNLCTLSTTNIISVALQDLIYLGAVSSFTVGSLSTNAYPTFDAGTDPIPSIYRGYYFTSAYYMTYSSLIITPYFTVTVWVKPTASGSLLLKVDSTSASMFAFSFTVAGYASLTLRLQDGTTVASTGLASVFGSWHNIAFIGDNSSGKTVIKLYTDGGLIGGASTATSTSTSPFIDSSTGTLYVGSQSGSNGFTGFLWSFKFFNGNTYQNNDWITSGCPTACSTSCPSEKICPDSCAFGYFNSGSGCTQCGSGCGNYGCRSTDTCRLCQTKECLACTLFDGTCSSCITNASQSGTGCACNANAFWKASSATCELCDSKCSTCAGTYYFLCNTCSSGTIVGNVCLNGCPQGYSASPCTSTTSAIFQVPLDTSFSGAYSTYYQTSTSSTTYQFFVTPDALDPVPAYKRGLYFSGGQYLITNTNVLLSNNVSMGLWIYVISSGDILQKSPGITLSSSGVLTVTLENPSLTTSSLSTTALTAFSGWAYVSFSISFSNGDTSLATYLNGAAGSTASSTTNIYRDTSNVLYIGKSSGSSFTGFIYYFTLWNAAITTFTSSLSIPCSASSSPYTSCLWSCTISQYYSSSCTSCSDGSGGSCSYGCVRASSCNVCYDPLCKVCTSFNSGDCSTCVDYASGGGATACYCNTNYISTGFACVWACTTGCAGCTGTQYYQCTSCDSGYYYLNGLCLTSCPTGYTADQNPTNACTQSTATIYSLAFQDIITLSSTGSGITIGSSNSNSYPTFDTSDPIPSIYRGYYFTSSYTITLSSVKPYPFYSIVFWVRQKNDGKLLSQSDGNTQFINISFSSGKISIVLILEDSSTVTLSDSSTTFTGSWHSVAFEGNLNAGKTKISYYLDGTLISTQSSANSKMLIDQGTLYIGKYSGTDGFTGFLWSLKIFNENGHYLDDWVTSGCPTSCSSGCPSEKLCPDTCEFGYYYDTTYSACKQCDSSQSCGGSYGCRSLLTCRLCKTKECSACSAFDGACSACINNAYVPSGNDACQCNLNAFWIQSSQTCEICDSLCDDCAETYYHECSQCSSTKIAVDTVCLHECPTGYTYSSPTCTTSASSIIDQSFYQDWGGTYGIFQTSSSAASYYFSTTVDTQDPVPVYNRGLYFSGGKYLVSTTNIYLAHYFSVGLWVYVITAGDVFQKNSRVILNSAGSATIVLEQPLTSSSTVSVTSATLSFTGWVYLSLTVSYSQGTTTIQTRYNTNSGAASSSTNNIFRDVSSDVVYIGKSTSSSTFEGYVYSITVWNTAVTDFSTQLSLSVSSLWACGYGQYYDDSACQSCAGTCALGCRRALSCNYCDDILCKTCSGFLSNECSLCVDNASGPGTGCACDPGFKPSSIGDSCINDCKTGCASCMSSAYYDCNSCNSGYYYISNMCFTACPTGYTADASLVCILVSDSALSLSLQNLIYLDSVSSIQVGSSSSNTYPTWDTNDPIPSSSRGYYFTSGKYMDAGAFMLSPFFTVTIWVKPIGLGYLMVKINGSTEMFGIKFDTNGYSIAEATLNDGTSVSITSSSTLFGSWHNLAYTGNIVSGYSTISLYLDGASSPVTQTSTSVQPFIDSGSLSFGYSSIADSFEGFLWSLKIYNKNTYQASEWITSGCPSSCSSGCPSEQLCPDSCAFGEYYDTTCKACDGTFSCSYGCRSWDTCRLCKSKECDVCTTFSGDCTHCITNAEIVTGNDCACKDVAFWIHSSQSCELCDDLCTKCLGSYYFECQTCTTGAQKVDNICLHACPYGFDASCNYPSSSQVINQVFGDNFRGQYGEFITGTSALTYQFFNTPELNIDPIPAKNRGFYFSNGSYLQATTIYLNYKFSIGFWAYVKTAGDMLEKQPNLKFSSDASSIVYLENPSLTTLSVSTSAITYTAGWNYFAITVAYTPGSTTVACYVNVASSSPATTTNNRIFRDVSSQPLLLGKSSTSSTFEGFIYNFNLWTDTITDFSYQINDDICNTGQGYSCLWDCAIDKYKDTDGSCKSCNSCSLGCTRGVSCGICDDNLCDECNGFGANLCYLCVTHASGAPGSACACDPQYYLNPDGFSCSPCPMGCKVCSSNDYYMCSACTNLYFLISGMCLGYCPTGYTADSTLHECTLPQNPSLSVVLNNDILLNIVDSMDVGSDNTNKYPDWTDTNDPTPAILRGYYFYGTQSLSKTSFVISISFSVLLWLNPIVGGYVVVKSDGTNEYLKIILDGSGNPSLTVLMADSSSVSITGTSSLSLNNWHFLAVTGKFNSGITQFTMYLDNSGTTNIGTSNSGNTYFNDQGTLYIGSNNLLASGFTGFLWSFKVYLDETYVNTEWQTTCPSDCATCPSELICPSICPIGEFGTSTCTTCVGTATYGCRNTDTVRLCKAKECKTCEAFDGDCTDCITHAHLVSTSCTCDVDSIWVASSSSCELCDDPICTICSATWYFDCTTCNSGNLVGPVCLYDCPTGYTVSCTTAPTSAIIDALLYGTFSGSYSSFTTGVDNTKYFFFHSPEAIDPIPAYKRGLYFSSGSYLEYSSTIYLSHSFSIGLWVNIFTSGDILEKDSYVIINSNGVAKITLETPTATTQQKSTATSTISGWSYISLTVSYSSAVTTMTFYVNNSPGTPAASTNLLFRDAIGKSIILGKSSSSNFQGFIYNFKLWNTPITDFSTYYSNEICGNGNYATCLWDCDIDKFYSTSCTACLGTCNDGCRRSDTCNICNDVLCDICDDFETGTCTQCISHASGTPCSCDIGYSLSNDGLSCNTCYLGCASCTGGNYNQCGSCSSSYYYIGGLCEQDCPTGYTANGSPSNSCDLIDSTTDVVLYMNLIDKVCLNTVSGFDVGSSNANVYPDWDANDPIPSKSRGYYFTGTSYMKQNFKFSPFFTLSAWIKGTNDGYLLTKYYSGTSYLYIVFSSGIPTLTITLQDTNTLSVTCGTASIFNSWSFLSFTGEVLSDGKTKLQCYLGNSFVLSSTSASYLRDNSLGNIIIGTKEDYSSGFIGYIWNLKIFITSTNQGDDYSSSGCTASCTTCPADKNCLSECAFSTYPTACASCKTSCNKGCVSGLACSLCKNKECNHCDTFTGTCIDCITHAGFVGTDCKCDTNALWNDATETCDLCYNLCGSCTAYTFTSCTSCISSHYLCQNLCINYCPTGYTASSNQCVLDSSLNGFVFNMMPHQIMDTVKDLQSSFLVQTGQNSNFYPTYDTTDPYAAEYRGYYFLGTSYMSFLSSSLLFAPKFTISTWINPSAGNNIILSKQDSSLVAYLELAIFSDNKPMLTLKLFDGTVVTYKSSSTIILSQWNLIIVSSDISSTPAQIISFNVNSATDTSLDQASSWFEDIQSSSTTIIGAHYTSASTLGDYFTGYLWDLKVYNLIKTPSDLYSLCPGCSQCPTDNSGSCLVNCPISKYWDGTTCTDCDTGCASTGCVRVDINCNLCDDVICYECHDYTGNCISCRPHAHLESGKCVCDTGYSWDSPTESCILCYSSCKSCTGTNFYECVTCNTGYYLVDGLCLPYCPSGYKATSNVCFETNKMMFDLELETLNGVIYDKASLIPVLTGSTSNFYMNYDIDDPVPAPLRGMWFNGNSSILHLPTFSKYSSPLLIIGPMFTYSIWINPFTDTSTIMYTRDASSAEEFGFKLNSGYPSIELNLKFVGLISHQCKMVISLTEWNHVLFTLNIDALGHSYIQCTVNTIPDDSAVDLGLSYYLTSKTNPSGTIGGEIQGTNYVHYYQGFIYKIVMYHSVKTIENFAIAQSYCSENCPSCLTTKNCIPNCIIDKYWLGPAYNACSNCQSSCKYGCKDASVLCNMCYNTLCSNCTDYDSSSCTNCTTNAENTANCICEDTYGISKNLTYCAPCDSNAYTEDGYCKTCPSLCKTCTNSTNCLTCLENSHLTNGACKCNVGFNGTTDCTEIWFYANMSVNDDDSLNLTFSNDLAVSLDSMDILISIVNVSDSNLTWTMEERNSSFYYISLEILTKISAGTQVILKFLSKTNVVSVSNELLINDTLTSYLYYYNPYSEDPAVHAITSQTTAVVQSVTGVVLAVSFINPNPSSLWSMLNVLQYLSYLGLSKIPMSNSFYAFVTSMNGMYYFPNIFKYFINEDQGTTPYDQAVRYGYDTDLILMNIGSPICTVALFFIMLPCVYLLSSCSQPFVAKKLSVILRNYKYSLFVRFWIQAYLDFCAATALAMINFSMKNPSQYINVFLCIALFIFESITPILFFMFSYKNLNRIQHKERGFERLWSSFFYEFKNDQGLMSTQYYSIFFLRRLIYIFNLTILIDYPATQVTINSILSFATVFYLIRYKPYLEMVQQVTNVATEIGVFLFVTIMAGNVFGLSNSSQAKFELTMVVVAIGIMAVQMCGSLVIFAKTCYEIIKDGIKKTTGKGAKHLEQVNDPAGDTIHMDRDTEFYRRGLTGNMTLARSQTRPTAIEEFILD